MNISILTHPLGANYGGILQAYALCSYLRKQGHEVFVLNRNANMPLFKRVLKSLMVALRHPRYNLPRYHHLLRFVKQYIPYSKPIYTSKQMTVFLRKKQIQASIVGSDQVWRTDFAMGYGYDYFLEFVPHGIKKISYAASFGLSNWEYNDKQTHKIRHLVKEYEAVSVREDEGVDLCQEYLGIKAAHVLDPTMLLSADEYDKVSSPRIVSEDYIFIYWLGSAEEKQKALLQIRMEGKKIVDISLRGSEPLMPIEDWLSYIKYADHVVTDSFHGCVFSILFHKQFSICANKSGGNGRLKSLFTMLSIDPSVAIIDYSVVDEHLKTQRKESETFLKQALIV